MTQIIESLTPEVATRPSGDQAREAILSTLRIVFGHTSSFKSMKGHSTWLPRYLQPTVTGDYYPLNNNGFRIGCNTQTVPRRDWVIPASSLNLSNLAFDRDDPEAWIDLFQDDVPWISEGSKSCYIGRLMQVFGIDRALVQDDQRRSHTGIIFGN